MDRGFGARNKSGSCITSSGAYCKLLPESFKPGPWDVICQRGKIAHDHVGNIRFQICIGNHLQVYWKASNRSEKSAVISNIVDSIRNSSTSKGGGFVRLDRARQRYYEVGDKVARDKVGMNLRDALAETTSTNVNTKRTTAEKKREWLDKTWEETPRDDTKRQKCSINNDFEPLSLSALGIYEDMTRFQLFPVSLFEGPA